VRVEPSVNRAIDFGVADGVFAFLKGKITLTDKGKLTVRDLDNVSGVFEPEKEFLSRVGNRLTDDAMKRLTEGKP